VEVYESFIASKEHRTGTDGNKGGIKERMEC